MMIRVASLTYPSYCTSQVSQDLLAVVKTQVEGFTDDSRMFVTELFQEVCLVDTCSRDACNDLANAELCLMSFMNAAAGIVSRARGRLLVSSCDNGCC